jgi:hypothetical protein
VYQVGHRKLIDIMMHGQRNIKIEIYVFRGNPFQTHSLQQSYHPKQPFKQEKYNTKSKI